MENLTPKKLQQNNQKSTSPAPAPPRPLTPVPSQARAPPPRLLTSSPRTLAPHLISFNSHRSNPVTCFQSTNTITRINGMPPSTLPSILDQSQSSAKNHKNPQIWPIFKNQQTNPYKSIEYQTKNTFLQKQVSDKNSTSTYSTTHFTKSPCPRTKTNPLSPLLCLIQQPEFKIGGRSSTTKSLPNRIDQSQIRGLNNGTKSPNPIFIYMVNRFQKSLLPRPSLCIPQQTLLHQFQRTILPIYSTTPRTVNRTENLHKNNKLHLTTPTIQGNKNLHVHRRLNWNIGFLRTSPFRHPIDNTNIHRSRLPHQLRKKRLNSIKIPPPSWPKHQSYKYVLLFTGEENNRSPESRLHTRQKTSITRPNNCKIGRKTNQLTNGLLASKTIRLATDNRPLLHIPHLQNSMANKNLSIQSHSPRPTSTTFTSKIRIHPPNSRQHQTHLLGSIRQLPLSIRLHHQENVCTSRLNNITNNCPRRMELQQPTHQLIRTSSPFKGNIPHPQTTGTNSHKLHNRQPSSTLLPPERRIQPFSPTNLHRNHRPMSLQEPHHQQIFMDSISNEQAPRLPLTTSQSSEQQEIETDPRLPNILRESLAPLTYSTRYQPEWSNFITYLDSTYGSPLPIISRNHVLNYFCSLHNTPKAYLAKQIRSALEHMSTINFQDPHPFRDELVRLTCESLIRNAQTPKNPKKDPFTHIHLLKLIESPLQYSTKDRDIAFITISLFALLRPAESKSLKNNSLRILDDDTISLTFKRLKRPPGEPPTTIIIRNIPGLPFSPVNIVKKFLIEHSERIFNFPDHPLFPGLQSHKPLSSLNLKIIASKKLALKGLFSDKSLRIGGACFAAARNLSNCEIMSLGGWTGTSFLKYIRDIPRLHLQVTASSDSSQNPDSSI